MSTARLRVALAGAGMISANHLVAWQRQSSAHVVAICDPNEERARARAAEFGIGRTFSDFAAMLDAMQPDAVDIASPVETHASLVRAALAAGLATLCQKPLCPTLDEAERLVADAPRDARLMVHENWRFRPWYRAVASQLASRELGVVRQVRMSVLGSGLLRDANGALPAITRQPFMARLERLIVAEALIHHLDVLRWLLGPLRVESAVVAHGCPAVRGESCATALMRDGRGAAVILEGNMMAHGYPARASDRLEIIADAGRILLDGSTLLLEASRPERQDFDLAAGYQASFDGAVAHFVESLCSGAEFETSPADNLATLRLVEAVYVAAHRETT